ncbi:MAG: YraN family protein [Deltaproteobacteria bacterium RIFCSPLOWO2_02_FULL_50_16]|nr:MAG: YraN family protein [Deltaproteobacteria bacterium GWA2_50_8]OGQ25689.1 MAG: YraN family protein [Deltaproteobacteria bacterium RIFCSPHIGHO2_02_FULL_50_15]OGQ56952.1 MAG: YraN family protein [Deltaproteobacteria bacterium RIFCSPLOWO2_02_FULL_50_16]OGQ68030.1 MAG: YraN family protein [Deltaproteobacteria bacterium RIFCSPLOWO2_12_FULL_50_11]
MVLFSKDKLSQLELGQQGEKWAEKHLKSKGIQIVEKNYRCPFGEIDLIGRDRERIIFVEVKTRRSEDYGGGEEAITPQKMEKMTRSALHYLQRYGRGGENPSFALVVVTCKEGKLYGKLIEDAFDAAWGYG